MNTIGSSVAPSSVQSGTTQASILGAWERFKSPVKADISIAPGDTDRLKVWCKFVNPGGSSDQYITVKRGSVTIMTFTVNPPDSQNVDFCLDIEMLYESCGLTGSIRPSVTVTVDTLNPRVFIGSPVTVNTTNLDEYDVLSVSNDAGYETTGMKARLTAE